MTATPIEIELRDIGPIERFAYTMPEPGLHLLLGDHGVGKSATLRTIELVTNGITDIPPTKRDGTPRGEATIAGKTLRIMQRQTRTEGDLAIEGLGDLSIADLHQPRFKEAHTRDAHRIRTLVRLAGAEANPALFHRLTDGPERFDKLVPADAMKTDDLVDMAARIKRAFEAAAQVKEAEAETAKAHMAARRESAAGVDVSAESDETALRAALTDAVERRAKIQQQRVNADEVLDRAQKARTRLSAARVGDAEAAKADVTRTQAAVDEASATIRTLEAQLSEARTRLTLAQADARAAQDTLRSLSDLSNLVEEWNRDIAAAEQVNRPTDEHLRAAGEAVGVAQRAMETGASVRAARVALAQAEAFSAEAKKAANVAQRLRDAARDTFTVLSDAIKSIPDCPLKVAYDADGRPRLVISTDRSDTENFDELSDGERWGVVVRIAAARNKVMVLSQAALGEMSDASRDVIDRLARERGCYIVSAQVTDGELRGVSWAEARNATVMA